MTGKTVHGAPVLKIDEDHDGRVTGSDPALVVKIQGDGGQPSWKPVGSREEFKALFDKATLEDKRDCFGVWRDSREWLIFPGNGIPENKEVETLGHRWSQRQAGGSDTIYSPEYQQDRAWVDKWCSTVDEAVRVDEQTTLAGSVFTLREPQRVTACDAKVVAVWANCGGEWGPWETHNFTQTL